MKRFALCRFLCLGLMVGLPMAALAQPITDPLLQAFKHPPEAAKPWVFWYWMQASVSREGITADLQAMKDAGIGGAYLMTIKGATNPPLLSPPVEQLSPQWWAMVKFAMQEADRIGVKLAMHDCDGFAIAGGPWITPALSMQRVTWSKTLVQGGKLFNDTLAKPPVNANYYQDIAVFAYPQPKAFEVSTETIKPVVTTSKANFDAQFLAAKGNKKTFSSSSDTACYIQYAFEQPFTCRSITIHTNSGNFQAQRLLVQVSNDGQNFATYTRLEPARTGWQDEDEPYTYTLNAVTAKYFRFLFDKNGTEPGAEDIDAAKWKPNFKISGITLYTAPQLNQFEGKNGSVWRVAKYTTSAQVADSICIPKDKLINITPYLDKDGRLNWNVPEGNWVILRMGHTSTGHTNETGGAGRGLECDKFNPEAVKLQFSKWYAEAIKQAGPDLAAKVLKIFHVDSWECGSQNWSPVFAAEFKKRRGYDVLSYLPAMAGVPVQNADSSERYLHDVRQTIAELLVDNFFHTMASLAHQKGAQFSAECTAPTMEGDGLLHYKEVDLPMGEFWLRSPTHDKPNDVLDGVSGAHIYGKPIIPTEAFTELRMAWDEHPGIMKTLGDRNYALGVNRFVLHVFMHNPWPDRKPGMTLDGVGSFIQRDQTWWKPAKAWISYLQRCQALLQMGSPVVDIAVYTGGEYPRRAILPDRLVPVMPGIFGQDVVDAEAKRLANIGLPLRTFPAGVTSLANMTSPADWVNPLRGYSYDSFNEDALLRLAAVKDGRLVLPGGASYRVLVLPGATKMDPNEDKLISAQVIDKINQLSKAGVVVLNNGVQALLPNNTQANSNILVGPYQADNFNGIGLARDMIATDSLGEYLKNIAFTHRKGVGFDIYFISNQENKARNIELSLRVTGKVPELWDALTGDTQIAADWKFRDGRTLLPLHLAANGSVFVVLRHATTAQMASKASIAKTSSIKALNKPWQVKFDPAFGGPAQPVTFNGLSDWSQNADTTIKYYSGTASYRQTIQLVHADLKGHVWLDLGKIANIAHVYVNDVDCGVVWTAPFKVELGKALHLGSNNIVIEVSNTWANRLIGDSKLPAAKRVTQTTAPYRLGNGPLLPAGLVGPVSLITY